MRALIALTPLALGLALSACAGGPTGEDRYETDLDRLTASCTARGGILVHTGNQTGRAQTDNVCEIRGQTGRAPSG